MLGNEAEELLEVLAGDDTATLVLRALFFTGKVPSAGGGQDSRQAQSSQVKGTFSYQEITLS